MKAKMSFIFLIIISLASCSITERTIDRQQDTNVEKNDSISERTERDVTPYFVPASLAQLNLSKSELDKLPPGAMYQSRSDNATATVTRVDSVFVFKANCDSLTILVESLRTEIFHLNSKNTVLKEYLSQQDIKVINEPTSWQWFQIHGFRVLIIINLIILLWQKRKLLFV
ncbi:MAG: hypothetical protein AB7E34_10585 [Acidaminococcaceae bacterium]